MPARGPGISTKPYLVRAIYEWCTDSGYRPFIAVAVDERTRVPLEFVRDGEIVLNISAEATDRLHIGNDVLEFDARFGGIARHVSVPIDNIGAIFAQETGHGMAFEVQPVRTGGPEPTDAAKEDEQPSGIDSPSDRQPAAEASDEGKPDEEGPGGRAGAGDAVPNAPRAARRTSRRKAPVSVAPGPQDAGEAAPTADHPPARKSASKRARKTVLRDVSAPVEERAAPGRTHKRRDGDEPDPDGPKPGKPHLTRVK